ncbi:hypothetical protein JTB14_000353 [Gonioctena quinquepunctata]|nr:hypothetical protein JTB14_000353 [Gonioctena quinquepunctata]
MASANSTSSQLLPGTPKQLLQITEETAWTESNRCGGSTKSPLSVRNVTAPGEYRLEPTGDKLLRTHLSPRNRIQKQKEGHEFHKSPT